MWVDEPGAHEAAASVDRSGRIPTRHRRAGIHDLAVGDSYAASNRGRATAIDDPAVADQDVNQTPLPGSECCGRTLGPQIRPASFVDCPHLEWQGLERPRPSVACFGVCRDVREDQVAAALRGAV